ncbi:polyphosphate polymerase domain-containing protein [Vallitaleaceae bacterium 9-2]
MYRNELKYIIDENTAGIIRGRIKHVCPFDKNSDEQGFYQVTSLYFDDYNNSALGDNVIGRLRRKKYRIRIYNGDDHNIRLEKKVKHNQVGFKETCQLTREQYNMIMQKNYSQLKSTSKALLIQEFCLDALQRKLQPKVIVDYDRQTFVYQYGDVRVTLDYDIRHSTHGEDLFNPNMLYLAALNPNQVVLEIKYTGFLPEHIKQLVQQNVTKRQSISKYTLCRSRQY